MSYETALMFAYWFAYAVFVSGVVAVGVALFYAIRRSFGSSLPPAFDGSNEAIEAARPAPFTQRVQWPSDNAAKGEANQHSLARPGLAKTFMLAYLEAEISLPNGGHTYDDDRFQAALEQRGYRIIPLDRDVGSHG